MPYWRLWFFKAPVTFCGFWGPNGLFRNGFVQFGHPYIFIIHGSVLFAGIAGKKKKAVEVGTLKRE